MPYDIKRGKNVIEVANLLLIGSTARNSGKTTLAVELAKRLAGDVSLVALKVTRISDEGGGCPHGEQGCGLCEHFKGNFCLERETDSSSGKDTSLLLESGLRQVYWLRAREEALADGYNAFVSKVGSDCLIIAESNSLRKYVQPLVFIMIVGGSSRIKTSARAVLEQADLVIDFNHIFERRETVVRDIMKTMCGKTAKRQSPV
jgi:shikimate kinase